MATVVRNAARSATTPANGWTEDLRWYAAAMHQMKLLTPRLDEYRPLALRANDLAAVRNPTPTQTQQLRQTLAALAPIITAWSDPRSLGYQAQVHATYLLTPADWPKHQGTTVLWHECAHGSWFFLPWHRAYLLEFEAVARAHIATLGGPHETWALPYWNSSDYRSVPGAANLPRPLADATVPGGVEVAGLAAAPDGSWPNPLHEPSRDGPAPLAGLPSVNDWADASAALQRLHFANAQDSNQVSFGGGYLEDLTRFHNASELGQMDLQPHGQGHVETGGFMSSFFTAGLDPAFWMHHANVDRLWETYARDLGHGYPFHDGAPAGALGAQAFDSWSKRRFDFLRPDGSVASWTAPQVLDVGALGYAYDTIKRPVFNQGVDLPPGGDIDPFGLDREDSIPVPVAAASNLDLAGAATITLTGGGDDGLAGAAGPGQRWHVRFDGLRSERPVLTSYAVYLGLDDDQAPDADRLVGSLSLFGVFESSLERNGNLGSQRVLDASGVVARLADLDPTAARLTLVPDRDDRDLASMGLTVERVSLEVG